MNPNDLGVLAEGCQKIKISDFLRKTKAGLKEAMIKSELEVEGMNIELATSRTGYNGVRFWFKCPLCNLRVGVLFKHPINGAVGCRKCLKLEYRKRRYKGMIENRLLDSPDSGNM